MYGKLLTIASMIAVVIAIPVEHDLLDHNLLDHEWIDLSGIDFGKLANILMTPDVPKFGEHIVKVDDVSDKLKHGAKRVSHFIDTQKEAKVGAALLPFEVSSKSAAIGGAIPAAAAVKGTIIGSAIATPIIIKSIALPGAAAAKTAAILSVPAIVTHGVKTKVEESTHNLFSKGTIALKKGPNALKKGIIALKGTTALKKGTTALKGTNALKKGTIALKGANVLKKGTIALNKGTNALKKGAFGAIGLAAKGAAAMKAKAVVAGKLILRPIAIITGAQLKFLGTGLTLAGKGVSLTGAGIKKVGTGLKLGGLGAVGIGATAIGWGLDKTTIDLHLKEGNKFTKF